MRVPDRISPAARARRALLVDSLAAAALTILALLVSGGIGIVGFAGLLVATLMIAWIAVEKAGQMLRRRWRRRRRDGLDY